MQKMRCGMLCSGNCEQKHSHYSKDALSLPSDSAFVEDPFSDSGRALQANIEN